MALSSTVTFSDTIDFGDLFTEAFERCGIFGPDLATIHLESAQRSGNLLFSKWSNQQPRLWAVDQQTQVLTADDGEYNLASGTVAVLEAAIRYESLDRRISPISRSEYLSISDKAQSGPPTAYYVQRTLTPVIYLWPVQDATGYTLVYNRARIQYDVSNLLYQNADAPNRWMEAVASGLAAMLAVKWAPDKVPMLKADADEAFTKAMMEDRERVPLSILPDLSRWT